MTDRHTPGPWKRTGSCIRSDYHLDGPSALLLTAGPMFHDYDVDTGEQTANLALAAAAPDLLAALKAAITDLEAAYEGADDAADAYGVAATLKAARAAIVKAEGSA
jgi:hypothetical protein